MRFLAEVAIRYNKVLSEREVSPERRESKAQLPEIMEIPEHPWFIGVQFHPELKSRPLSPHPLFASFIAAAMHQSRLV